MQRINKSSEHIKDFMRKQQTRYHSFTSKNSTLEPNRTLESNVGPATRFDKKHVRDNSHLLRMSL